MPVCAPPVARSLGEYGIIPGPPACDFCTLGWSSHHLQRVPAHRRACGCRVLCTVADHLHAMDVQRYVLLRHHSLWADVRGVVEIHRLQQHAIYIYVRFAESRTLEHVKEKAVATIFIAGPVARSSSIIHE